MTVAKRRIITITALALFIFLAVFYFTVNPEVSRAMPQCVFHRLTGLDCPGCGSQRMIHALLHADLAAAWRHNPFLICISPVILIYVWLEFFPDKTPRLFRIFHSTTMISAIGAAILAWGVLRNIL
ncbi:MAG: DUF2752 domain-containing protein [Muribaculaceae bacterium]|nr:DUF2752 domain-containing protein [Muribaculaceae bacterium]MDE6683399.1 DUF2752 domain-containing protein [Muribaculaceae bacterium]